MKPPAEATWERVEALAKSLESVAPEQFGAELARLRGVGESATVLTLLSGWLALPLLPSSLAAGTLVGGRYTLRAKIGEGGMGSVWRARQEQVGRDVALKIIHPALATPELRARFQKEIEMLALLDHPGIVKVFDAGIHQAVDHQEVPYLAMELVEGEHLDTWAAHSRHDRSGLLQAASAICLAIHTAHERQVVHRDLKPSNIIIKPNGQPVILDFGIARLSGIVTGDVGHQFSGTPQYAAPEQHLGNDRDFRSGESVDVYAMGAIVFEMVSGGRLFEFPAKTPLADIRKAVVEGKPRRLSDVLPDCSANLDDFVARAVRRNPADRFFSIAAFGRALTRAAGSLDTTKLSAKPWQPAQGLTIPGTGWCLIERLGSGSTGEVWLGRHSGTDHVRVFKFCDSEEKVRSLKREATLFRLLKERVGRHPNLIQLHEVSLDEAPFYLMMEQCDAKELGIWCSDQPGGIGGVSEAIKIEIVAQAADALQAAHEAGILHRDIKPANLLIGNHSEKGLVHVFVADFGIGQIVAEDLLRDGTFAGFTGTISGALSGSLRYMAPEVLEGNAATARSDIYCLGVVLWQLLVGNLNAALDPTGWDALVEDPLLRTDLARCLSGKPELRWSSAAELAASLRSLPARREAAQKREAELRDSEKAAYRRGALRSASIVAVVLTLVAVSLGFAWRRTQDAKAAQDRVIESNTRSTIAELWDLIKAHSGDTRKRLDEAMAGDRLDKIGFKKELREVAIAALAMPSFEPLTPPPFTLGPADSFSSSGDVLGTVGTNGLEYVELATGTRFPIDLGETDGVIRAVSVRPTSKTALVVDGNGLLSVRGRGRPGGLGDIGGTVYRDCIALSPWFVAGVKSWGLAVARPAGTVDVYPIDSQERGPLSLAGRRGGGDALSGPATILAFSSTRNSILAVATSDSGFVNLWSITGLENTPLTGRTAGSLWHPDDILSVAWKPFEPDLATGGRDGFVRLWRVPETPEPPLTEPFIKADLAEPVMALSWSYDGSLLTALLKSGRIKVLRIAGLEIGPVAELTHRGASAISFTPGGQVFAWGGTNGTKAWGPKQPDLFFNERRLSGGNARVSFHKRGSMVAVVPDRFHFLDSSTLSKTMSVGMTDSKSSAAMDLHFGFYSEGNWKYMRGREVGAQGSSLVFSGDYNVVPGVHGELVSPFSQRTATNAFSMLTLSVESDRETVPAVLPEDHRMEVLSDWEPASAWVAAGDTVHIFNHRSGKLIRIAIEATVLGLSFSPRAPLVACRTVSDVILVDSRTGAKQTIPYPASGLDPSPIAFSPDGEFLAFEDASGDLAIGTIQSDQVSNADAPLVVGFRFTDVARFTAPNSHPIRNLAWSPTGSHLCVGTGDGFVQSWNLSLLRSRLRLYQLNWGSSTIPPQQTFVPVRRE